MSAEPGFKVSVEPGSDGNWHVHCTGCDRIWGECIGIYTDSEAAAANAAHHEKRADHRPVTNEW
jgi:hypothetical protein